MSIELLLNTPWDEGFVGGNLEDVPFPWPVSIKGRPFAVDLSQYSWGISTMIRSSTDQSARPGEQSLDVGGVWKRVFLDASLGAGQLYADGSKASDQRFSSSLGVDVWAERKMALLPDTEVAASALLPAKTGKLCVVGNFMYLITATDMWRANDWTVNAAGATLVNITGAGGSPHLDITTDGGLVFGAISYALFSHDPATTTKVQMANDAHTMSANLVSYANGFLCAAVANELSLVSTDGIKTSMMKHHAAGFTWTFVVGAPNAVYAGGQANDVAEIYRFDFDATTGGFLPGVMCGIIPRGELIYCATYYGGLMFIGTSLGFRLANIASAGELQLGPLIALPAPVLCACGDGEYVYFGWSRADDTHGGVGKAHLAGFTSDLVPAYASDLMTTTQADITTVARFHGMTFFGVANSHIYRPRLDGHRVPTGRIDLGVFSWGTFEPKTFVGMEIVTDPLEGTIETTVCDDFGTEYALEVLDNTLTTNQGRLLGLGRTIHGVDLQAEFVLTRSALDPTVGPVIRTITMRAVPVPLQVEKWTLPVICKSIVRVGSGDEEEFPQDVLAVRNWFVALRRSGEPVVYQEGTQKYWVVVRELEMPARTVERWGPEREGLQGMLLVTLHNVGG